MTHVELSFLILELRLGNAQKRLTELRRPKIIRNLCEDRI